MNYPLISEYLYSILSPEQNFSKLTRLRPVLDEDGQPILTSGNFAVVFKMEDVDDGKFYAVRCFLKDQSQREERYRAVANYLKSVDSPHFVRILYLEKELYVDTASCKEREFPIVLMRWVDGCNLDRFVSRNITDQFRLKKLAFDFCSMASWLIGQPFAHGDIKPDNVMVQEDGSLVLVDYDGMFVPDMKGMKSGEIGSPDFRHPLRDENMFDERIDDFALASMALSLKAISDDTRLYEQFGAQERLLFSSIDYRDLSRSAVFGALHDLLSDPELLRLYSMFVTVLSVGYLSPDWAVRFLIAPPQNKVVEVDTTKADSELRSSACRDEYGAVYSSDGKILIEGPDKLIDYSILEETLVICDSAFSNKKSLQHLSIPDSVVALGEFAFSGCSALECAVIPHSVKIIKDGAFRWCTSLHTVEMPGSVTSISFGTFSDCTSLVNMEIPEGVVSIGSAAFRGCSALQSIVLPESLTTVESNSFYGCSQLQSIYVPKGTKGKFIKLLDLSLHSKLIE